MQERPPGVRPARSCWYCKFFGVRSQGRRSSTMDLRPCFAISGPPPWKDRSWRPPPAFLNDVRDGRFHRDDLRLFMEQNLPTYYGSRMVAEMQGNNVLLEQWHRLRWWADNIDRIVYTRATMVCDRFEPTAFYLKTTKGAKNESEP